VKTALLSARDAADIGIPIVPLGDLHGQAAASLLGRLGARVRLGAKAAAVEALPAGGFLIRLANRGTAGSNGGEVIRADGVVLAVPPETAGFLLPPAAGHGGTAPPGPGPGQWLQIDTSPIVNVHVIYDRRVTRLPFAAAVNSPVQWVFDRTGPSGLREGQYLAISLSAADAYADVPAARLRERFLPAMAELFPAAAQARVVDCFVTRERRATMRQVSGVGRLRPAAATAVPGLVLAGAWTDTGWPDTMEGAVRSGLNATRELRRSLSSPALSWAAGRPTAARSPAVDSDSTGTQA